MVHIHTLTISQNESKKKKHIETLKLEFQYSKNSRHILQYDGNIKRKNSQHGWYLARMLSRIHAVGIPTTENIVAAFVTGMADVEKTDTGFPSPTFSRPFTYGHNKKKINQRTCIGRLGRLFTERNKKTRHFFSMG